MILNTSIILMPFPSLTDLTKFLDDRVAYFIQYNHKGEVSSGSPVKDIKIAEKKLIHNSIVIPPLNASNVVNVKHHHPYFMTAEILKSIPDSWDWGTNGKADIYPVFDQRNCGSCWAVSTSTALSDRFAIANTGKNPLLSPTFGLACDKGEDACDGGNPQVYSSKFLEPIGIPSNECYNYDWCCNTSRIPACDTSVCEDKKTPVQHLYHVAHNSTTAVYTLQNDSDLDKKVEDTTNNMKWEIINNGPIVGCIAIFEDFISAPINAQGKLWESTGNIYINGKYDNIIPHRIDCQTDVSTFKGDKPSNCLKGFHAIAITGWGTSKVNNEDVPYWRIRNSWKTSKGKLWNVDGYFNLAMYTSKNKYNLNCMLDVAMKLEDQIMGGFTLFRAGGISPPPKNGIHEGTEKKGKKGLEWKWVASIIALFCILIGGIIIWRIIRVKSKK